MDDAMEVQMLGKVRLGRETAYRFRRKPGFAELPALEVFEPEKAYRTGNTIGDQKIRYVGVSVPKIVRGLTESALPPVKLGRFVIGLSSGGAEIVSCFNGENSLEVAAARIYQLIEYDSQNPGYLTIYPFVNLMYVRVGGVLVPWHFSRHRDGWHISAQHPDGRICSWGAGGTLHVPVAS